jgi:mRNA-degrading endonuclease RelE of RelBE toxin-antitoxin system
MAEVRLTAEAAEQFDGLPLPIKARVAGVFERMTSWPNVTGAKPLRGRLAGHYRIRTGDWRVQFRVEGAKLLVERIGHRDRFYED